MSTSTIALLARYDRQVNADLAKVLATLTPEQWSTPLTGYFSSLPRLLDHLYAADAGWLGLFGTLRKFASLQGVRVLLDPPHYGEEHFASFEQYRTEREALDAVITGFAAELTEVDLATTFSYRNWRGEPKEQWYEGLLLHFFNHHTHHRGMIAQVLDQWGVPNDYSNLNRFLDD